jgi:ADP-glucose pyrophosphorylase
MSAYLFVGYWEDIGTVKSFFDANLELTDPNPPFDFFEAQRVVYTRAPIYRLRACVRSSPGRRSSPTVASSTVARSTVQWSACARAWRLARSSRMSS